MSKIFYLAYGSNLHPLRLTKRVLSARAVSVVEMPGNRLAFHKRSFDGSGKSLMYTEQGPFHKVYCVLYEFDTSEKTSLDKAEGKGSGYIEQLEQVPLNGIMYTPYVYTAQTTHIDPVLVPYDWHKDLVIAGAKYHGFPADYIDSIEFAPSKPDPDIRRTHKNENLIRQMEKL